MAGEDDVVMFRFANNVYENADEVAAGLTRTVQSIQEAARAAGGTQVPVDFGNSIIREAERAGREASAALARALDPSNLTEKVSPRQVNELLRSTSVGAFQQIQREADRLVSQLGPEAQRAVARSGHLSTLMDDVATTVSVELRTAYGRFRESLDRNVRSMLPTLGKITKGGDRSLVDRALGRETYALQPAAEARVKRIFRPASETSDASLNAEAFLAAETRADAARVRLAAAQSRKELEAARKELSQALADMVGREDPIAGALGLRLHPQTGLPTRKVGNEYEPVSNARDIAEQIDKYRELRRQVEETARLLGPGGAARNIGNSTKFFVDESGGAGAERFFETATQGGVEYLRLLDGLETRLVSTRRAKQLFEEEQAAPGVKAAADAKRAADKADADAERERLRQERLAATQRRQEQARAEADAARAERQAESRRQAELRRPRSFSQGIMQGAVGGGMNASMLDPNQIMGNIGKTVGTAARYSLAYGGFYQFLQALKDGVAIFADYQDSFTDFQVALGDGSADTQQMTNDLMDLSVALGENVGAAYDAAARGVRAFASEASEAEKAAAGLATASAAQKVAVIGNKSLTDATGDVVSVGSAFGMNAQQTELLLPDWLANAKRRIGGDPTQIAQGLSNFAVTANEAGFSGQEAANIIALIQSKTDESGQAVATRLSRIVQIVSGSTGRNLAGDVNRTLGHAAVDVTQQPKEMLEDFARAYVEAGRKGLTSLQGQIRSQLGGTSNIKELLPLLEEGGQKRLADALEKSIAGAGTSEYERKINTVMGQLKQIRGYIQNLVVLAANADIFAPFAIGVKVLTPTLHLLQSILQVYEKFEGLTGPVLGPVGTTAIEAGLGYAAFKKVQSTALAQEIAATSGVTGAVARAAGVAPAGAASTVAATVAPVAAELYDPHAAYRRPGSEPVLVPKPVAPVPAAPAAKAVVASEAAAAAAIGANTGATVANTAAKIRETVAANALIAAEARASIAKTGFGAAVERSGINTTGLSALFAKIGPTVLVTAAALAADHVMKESKDSDGFDAKELKLLASGKNTPAGLRNNADALDALAASRKKQVDVTGDYGNYNSFLMGGHDFDKRAQAEADLFREMAKGAEAEKKYADSLKSTSVFGDAAGRTADKVAEGFDELARAGKGASSSLDEYFNALMTQPADTLGSGEMPQTTTNKAISLIGRGTNKYINSLGENVAPGGGIGKGFADFWHNSQGITSKMFGGELPNPFGDNKGDVARHLDLGDQLGPIQDYISRWVEFAGPSLDQKTMDGIVRDAIDSIDTSAVEGEYADFDPKAYKDGLFKLYKKRMKVIAHKINSLGPLGPDELAALVQQQAGAIQDADPSDPTAGLAQARVNLAQLVARKRAGGGKTFDAQEIAIRNARHVLRQMAVAEAEDLRQAVESRMDPDASLTKQQAVRLSAAMPSYKAAGNDVALIEGLMESMDRRTAKAILQFRRTAVATAKMALDKEQQLLNEAQTMLNLEEGGPAMSGHPGAGAGGQDPSHKVKGQKELDKRRARWIKAQKNLTATQEAYLRSSFNSEDMSDEGSKSDKEKLTAWQQRALYGQAMANPRNSVSQARHGLDVARANLDAIKDKHSSEYFSALNAVTASESTLAGSLADRATSAANLAAARAGGGALASANAQIKAANDQLALGGGQTERNNALAARASGEWARRQAQAGKVGAIAEANAARIGGGIASARAGVRGAAAMLHAQARGTLEWWQQLGQFYSAQQSMRDAVLAYRNNRDLLRGDSTDPVEQARDAYRAAMRKLRQDRRRGAGRDVIAEDKVAVDSTDNELRASKFNQRFSDMQTNEELGRISFAKYMDYLDHEHDRLTRIKHRTRQQQDQLDQVDKAMKDALSSMDSQFNLGDINTNGMVYQVRRFKAEAAAQVAPTAAAGNTTHQTVSISINGADTAKVKTIIDGYLRIGGGQRQALTRRKV